MLAEAWGNGIIKSEQEELEFLKKLIKEKPDLVIGADGKSIIHQQIQDIEDIVQPQHPQQNPFEQQSQNSLRNRFQKQNASNLSLGLVSILNTEPNWVVKEKIRGKGAPKSLEMNGKG